MSKKLIFNLQSYFVYSLLWSRRPLIHEIMCKDFWAMPHIHIGLWWVVGSIQLILNGQHPEYVIARSHQLTKCADSEMCSSVVELTSRIDCTQTGNWFESSCTVLRWTQNAAYTQKQQTEVSRQQPALTQTVGFCSWNTWATSKQKKIGEYIFEKEEHCNALNVRVIFLV